MAAYYNEIDPYAAQWLRNLIAAGHIAPGDVDERDIRDVRPDDLRGYIQCHFFAGIGVWSSALRLAGWPDDRPVWTGSCPCQPFSAAGEGLGFADERHLWPAWFHLIRERRPSEILGEQVASKDAEPWLDLVSADMESLGSAFGSLAFPSAGVGAPHIRDRTYFVAHAKSDRHKRRGRFDKSSGRDGAAHSNAIGRMADADCESTRWDSGSPCSSKAEIDGPNACNDNRLGDACNTGSLAHASSSRPQEFQRRRIEPERLATAGFWGDAEWIYCRDGKWRPVEPGTFPLAHGATSRVGRLRAYGNAINAYQAAEFIAAARETIDS